MKLYSVASIFSEKTSASRETPSPTFPKQQMSHDKTSDKVPSSITHLPMIKPSPGEIVSNCIIRQLHLSVVLIQSSRSDATIDSNKTKGNRSNNSLQAYPDEHSPDVEPMNPHLSNTSNQIDIKTKDSATSKSNISEQYDWDREISQQSKTILPLLITTEKEEFSRSFHFQENMPLSNTNLGESFKIPSKESDQMQLLPTIDERSQSTVSLQYFPILSCLPSDSILPI